jgi:ribosomal protein L32E
MMNYNSMHPQGFVAVLIGNKSDLGNKRAVTFE